MILLAIFVVVGAGSGYIFLRLTGDPGVNLSQDPNPVEAYEAKRKLQIFKEAREQKRRGFIRLSEVEINSFIKENLHTNRFESNGLTFVKSGILLGVSNVTLVAWIEKPLFGLKLPLVWQRKVNLLPEEGGCDFSLGTMKVGHLQIPYDLWSETYDFLGEVDALFDDSLDWLDSIPTVQLEKNELSNKPELRLYTFVPEHTEQK